MGAAVRSLASLLLLCAIAKCSSTRTKLAVLLRHTAEVNTTYTGTTLEHGQLTEYQYTVSKDAVVRISMKSRNVTSETPLLAVFREPSTIISVQLPIALENYLYSETARTLCPFTIVGKSIDEDNVTISVELSSYTPVYYEFVANYFPLFELKQNSSVTTTATDSSPTFYMYTFPEDVDSIVISVSSDSSICMTVSVQTAGCPVFDLSNTAITGGMHQTMTKSGSITVERRLYEAFFVVFTIRPNDNECSEMAEIIPPRPHFITPRSKTFTINLEKSPNFVNYMLPVILTFAGILGICSCAVIYMFAMSVYERKLLAAEADEIGTSYDNDDAERGSTESLSSSSSDSSDPSRPGPSNATQDNASVRSYDFLDDRRDIIVARLSLHPKVADMSLLPWKRNDRKYRRYVFSLLTLSLFYALPVVQLVLTWQETVRLSGNLDLCWYNFRCARPFFVFFSFNNLISNIGYVVLGLFLLLMVKERDLRLAEIYKKASVDLKHKYGLPQHSGIMYAIGCAVVMEGVMSASYHICPSRSNYQFDTAFMYIICMLGMLRIYQLRHPDINAKAHVSYGFSACAIFLAMTGVYLNNGIFWVFFSIIYLIMMFVISVEFYFKGVWRFSPLEILRSIQYAYFSSRRCSCIIPVHTSRFFFLLIANILNFAIIYEGLRMQPKDFPSFLLLPFLTNLFLYLIYYIIMKFLHREKLRLRAVVLLVLSMLCWGSAGWFFMHNVTDWSMTAAKSRELNNECILMSFYDSHDVWHFLSATALFMSFSLINYIDDDLIWVSRDRIAVF